MRTLTTPVNTEIAAPQAGWCELYDIYLPSNIVTPWGTTNILRLTNLPGGFTFFTPKISPEASGTQGNAQVYQYWPIGRKTIKGDAKFANDKLQIIASNVTTDFAQMITAILWYDVPIIIRKVPTTISGLTADDCAVLWIGAIDSAVQNELAVNFECSSDLASMTAVQPSKNMHDNCRFSWADDFCTAIRFHPNNYKSKTVGASSTMTQINSSDLTEDSGSAGSYGTNLIDGIDNDAMSTSSEWPNTGINGLITGVDTSTNYITFNFSTEDYSIPAAVGFTGTTLPSPLVAGTTYVLNGTYGAYYLSTTSGGSAIDLTTTGSSDVRMWLCPNSCSFNSSREKILIPFGSGYSLSVGEVVVFFTNGTMPGGVNAGQIYYVVNPGKTAFQIATVPGGAPIDITSSGSGSILICAPFCTKNCTRPEVLFGGWKLDPTISPVDWGENSTGFWVIPDASPGPDQSGLKNAALKPWIQFDFGSAVTPALWRISSMANAMLEDLIKLVEFFSSPDGSTWNFESYFELPPQGGTLFDVLIPNASTNRYWRICIRTRYAQTLQNCLIATIAAYADSRNYWMSGRVTFSSTTTTVALRGVSVLVQQSYSGNIIVDALPIAPVSGDTFIIERGCSRTFNACAARLNTENYGGFTTLPYQTVVRQ